MPDSNVRIKKVSAYPIPITMKSATETLAGKIVKITDVGFLAEFHAPTLKPGEKFECAFELPVLHAAISEPVVLVKLYTQWAAGTQTAPSPSPAPAAKEAAPPPNSQASSHVLHLCELHFLSLSITNRAQIVAFVNQLARKK
jgi:hypothetical protein